MHIAHCLRIVGGGNLGHYCESFDVIHVLPHHPSAAKTALASPHSAAMHRSQAFAASMVARGTHRFRVIVEARQ